MQIDFQNVSKHFGTQDVLDTVSFRVHPGERVGVVGPNGAGKSTLCALATGELSPDKGEISIPQKARVGYLRQQLRPDQVDTSLLEYAENALPVLGQMEHEIHAIEGSLNGPELDAAGREKALKRLGQLQSEFEHRGGYALRHRAQAILSGLGFPVRDFGRPFQEFSGGWQMRAELARVLLADPDLLLLDEPTNFLDVPAIEWLREYLRSFPGTLLLISHDRYLLNSLTTVTLEVAGRKVTRYPGNYDYYIQDRRLRHEQLAAAHQNQERKREQMERFIERFRAKNTKSAQVQSRVKMLEKMEEIDLPEEIIHPPHIRLPPPPHSGVEMVRLEDAGLTYDGTRWVLRHLELRLERGEKTALIGFNGMGKTTLLRLLAGHLPPSEGRVVPGHQVSIGYFAQEFTETMDPTRTVFGIARQAAPDTPEKELRAILGSFRFSGDAIEKPVEVLSGGEKSRLALLRLLVRPANLLILDEPTSHLDIASREVLERALREYPGTLVLVSHDIEFVRHVATSVLAVIPEGVRRYYGDYDYYRAKLAAEQAATPGTSADSAGEAGAERSGTEERKARKRDEAQRRQLRYQKRKPLEDKVAAAEKGVTALHAEQTQLVQTMQTAEPGVDFAGISRRLGEIQDEINRATADWEQAAMALEELLENADGTDGSD